MIDPDTIHPFRARLRRGDRLLGTFLKLPVPHVTEVLAGIGFDFVILDEEHAPWTRDRLDTAILAARASNIASIVRVARPDAASILSALDCGATGVMVPHVASAEMAREIARAARYHGGTRGAAAARGGFYGARAARNYEMADEEACVIAMIEDAAALDEIEQIASTLGLDALFLGRGDLRLSLSNATGSAEGLAEAVERVSAFARDANITLSATTAQPDGDDAALLQRLGVTALAVSSDIGFIQRAARQVREAISPA